MNPTRSGPSPLTTALLGAAVLAVHLGLMADDTHPRTPAAAVTPEALPTATPTAIHSTAPVVVTRVQVAVATPPLPARAATPPRATAPVAQPLKASATSEPVPPTQPALASETPVADPPARAADEVVLAQAPATAAAAPAAGAAPPPSDPPPSTTLPYEVAGKARGIDYQAKGSLEWQRDAKGYEARMELSMRFLGSRVQTSRGGIGPEGLRPERFADKRSSERAAHMDHVKRQISFSNNAPGAELLPGMQDRLSLFMQLAGLMRARPRQAGDVIEFQVVGTGDAELWRFDVGPMETLDLPAGAIEARRLSRAPRKPHDSTVDVWLAPALGHLPVRLRVAQSNGDVADQRLARLP
ncbi:MAG: DUF3108 domain-containing protein [Hydrogenophaga sp.]|nr:DUF3108 domain-containing protein [Hydrogenophaga sp.]